MWKYIPTDGNCFALVNCKACARSVEKKAFAWVLLLLIYCWYLSPLWKKIKQRKKLASSPPSCLQKTNTTHTHAYMYAHTHTCTHTCMCACMHTCRHMYTHTHTHSHTHTHTHTHTLTNTSTQEGLCQVTLKSILWYLMHFEVDSFVMLCLGGNAHDEHDSWWSCS